MHKPLFELGKTFGTPVALSIFEEAGEIPGVYLVRHHFGDWGDISDDGEIANIEAINGACGEVLSEYSVNGTRIWISTLLNGEHTYTTFMRPEER